MEEGRKKDQEKEVSNPVQVPPELSWIQIEYIKHDKNAQWYIVFSCIFLISALIIFFATSSIFSLIVIALAAIASLIYANKEPNRVPYELYQDGFSINSRQYFFDEFRSFSPIVEKGVKGVIFNPIGRLQLPMNVYFDEGSAEESYEIIESLVVFEPYEPDFLQRIIDFIRF